MLDTLPPSVSEWGLKREQENEEEEGKIWFEGEDKGRKLKQDLGKMRKNGKKMC